MRETIILASGLKGNELIKNLAFHGINSMNVKVMGAVELARLSLLKSGILLDEDLLNTKEEEVWIAQAAAGQTYFENPTYSDILQISAVIRQMRMLIPEQEEECLQKILGNGVFREKNNALFQIYKTYLELLKQNHTLDGIQLIRKGILESRRMDADFLCLCEYPLMPLEEELLQHVSGGTARQCSVMDLYHITEQQRKAGIRIEAYRNCYGYANEAESVIDAIYKREKLDECLVAMTDTAAYSQVFFDIALLYDIPITFGSGIPITNSNPAKLLKTYIFWMTDGFFGADALSKMLSGESFDRKKFWAPVQDQMDLLGWRRVQEMLGSLRLTNHKEVNDLRIKELEQVLNEEEMLLTVEETKEKEMLYQKKQCLPILRWVAGELSLSPEEFIRKYTYIRKGNKTCMEKQLMQLDRQALSVIYEELHRNREAFVSQSMEDLMKQILKKMVLKQNSQEGALHVCSLKDALIQMRKNQYLVGMAASLFPGTPKEHYLLLDEDLLLFGEAARRMTSKGRVKEKTELLHAYLLLASALDSKICISYTGMNVSELKTENASSQMYELYQMQSERGEPAKELQDAVTKITYFEPALSHTREIGKAYDAGRIIVRSEKEQHVGETDFQGDLQKEYSPSALNTFFDCPRKFMLSYILGIPEPEEEKPFEIISATANGTLAHLLMERLANSDLEKEEFLRLSSTYFDRYIMQNPPILKDAVPAVKAQFLEMMETAYIMDPKREVVLKEEDIHHQHESGIRLHGFPDRVEKLEDGSYLIVDFKSGRTITHVQDDIDTCLQVVIYAYLLEREGLKVKGGEFRYLRLGESVTCKYDDEMKERLMEKCSLFRTLMEEGRFPAAVCPEDGTDPCRYCRYDKICGKNEEGGI